MKYDGGCSPSSEEEGDRRTEGHVWNWVCASERGPEIPVEMRIMPADQSRPALRDSTDDQIYEIA